MRKFFLLIFCTLFKWEIKARFEPTIFSSALTTMYILAILVFLNLLSIFIIIVRLVPINITFHSNLHDMSIVIILYFIVVYFVFLSFVAKKKYLKLYDNYQKSSFRFPPSRITLIYIFSSILLPILLGVFFKPFA